MRGIAVDLWKIKDENQRENRNQVENKDDYSGNFAIKVENMWRKRVSVSDCVAQERCL